MIHLIIKLPNFHLHFMYTVPIYYFGLILHAFAHLTCQCLFIFNTNGNEINSFTIQCAVRWYIFIQRRPILIVYGQSNNMLMKQDNFMIRSITQTELREVMSKITSWVLTVVVSDNFHPKLAHQPIIRIIEVLRSYNNKTYYHSCVRKVFYALIYFSWYFIGSSWFFLQENLPDFASSAHMINIIQNRFMFHKTNFYDLLKHILTFNNLY